MSQLGPHDTCPRCGRLRGYFHDVPGRCAADSAVIPAPTNGVVLRLRDSGIHPYAEGIRRAWLARLDNLTRPWVQGAAWDTNCFVTARKLIELSNSPWSGYSPADAHADYLAHAPSDQAWDKRQKCWDQAHERAASVALPEPEPGAEPPSVTVLDGQDDRTTETVGPPLNPIIDWHELFATEDDGEEWIVEPLLPARRMVALYSAPKAGKSLLMLEVAVGIATGREVLGTTPDQARRVLYVDFENDPRGDVRTRLEAMDVGPDQLGDLCYLTFPSLAKFDTEQGALDLMRHVEHYACEVVVIDTVSRAVAGEENENDTWLAFYRHTGLKLKQAGVACIRLDHSGKDKEKGMRGGSAKYGDVDAVWRLSAIGEETILLECTDHRMTVPTKSLTLTREEFPLVHRVAGQEAWLAALDAQIQETDRLLDNLQVPTGAGDKSAGRALREAGHKVSSRALREAIKVRRMRLDAPLNVAGQTPSQPAPGAGAAQVRRTGGPAPGAGPSVGPARRTPAARPAQASEGLPEDDDVQVACKGCFRPTTPEVARQFGGRCADCHRATGQTHQEDA